MLGGVVNAADKRHFAINHYDFAVHAAEHVGAHAHRARARIVITEHYARRGQRADKLVAEIGRAVAVQQHFNADAAPGGIQDDVMQLAAHVIVEPDKSFENDFTARLVDGVKHGGIKLVAVL